MLETCMNCGTLEVVFGRNMCGDCWEGGARFCGYCSGTYYPPSDPTPCAVGHAHSWCDRCATAWAGLCPDSDEAQVVKAVMA